MRRRPCRRPVISLCNIVLHLLVRHTALLRRLSSHSAHSTHFLFSNRFLEVPMRKSPALPDGRAGDFYFVRRCSAGAVGVISLRRDSGLLPGCLRLLRKCRSHRLRRQPLCTPTARRRPRRVSPLHFSLPGRQAQAVRP